MSSIWTPGGEVPIGDDGDDQSGFGGAPDGPDLDPELTEEMAASFDEARQRVLEHPASVIVTNHAMGLYELGALHLMSEPVDLEQAKLAIDAMTLLVEGLQGQLVEEPTLHEALTSIRMAFVEVSKRNTAT